MLSLMPMLDRSGGTPLYMQLYTYIRSEAEGGKLPQGSRLPSIRQLAQHLGVSKNTIEAAYGQLLAEGYIESRERGGYAILPLDELSPAPLRPANAAPSITPIALESKPPRYDFRYGDIAFDRFPHQQWKQCINQALSSTAASTGFEALSYGHRLGHPGLRQEIADFVYQSRGAVCGADQIFICAGTQYAISLLVQLLKLRTATIGIEEPGYDGVKTVLRNLDCRMQPIAIERDGIDVESLYAHKDITTVYVTPSHQFPLGMVMPVQKRRRLLQWADECEGLIIEDDYDSEFRYGSNPIPSLKALDSGDRVIYVGTFSKSFLPAARLTYVIMPRRLTLLMREGLESYSQSVSPIIQEALWLFMKQRYFVRHVRKMRRIYQSRHKAVTDAIRLWMAGHVDVIGDRSGMHLLLQVPGRKRTELLSLAEAAGCRVYDPSIHWNDKDECPAGCVMIGFGGLSEEELTRGIRRLAKAWFGN